MSIIKVKGRIKFNPPDKTNKHKNQSSWKVIAMINISGDICDYYSWFVKRRYNIELNKPLRGPHISFINDKVSDLSGSDDNERKLNWEALKSKWDGKEVEIELSTDARTDGKHWWLNIPHESRGILQEIRDEVELGRPFYGMHMSLGYANEKNIEHSKYIHEYLKIIS